MTRQYVSGLMLIAVIYVLSYPVLLRIKYGVNGTSFPPPQADDGTIDTGEVDLGTKFGGTYKPVEMAIDSIPAFETAMTWIAMTCSSETALIEAMAVRRFYRAYPPQKRLILPLASSGLE